MAVNNNSKLKTEDSIFIPPHPLNTAVLFLVFNRLDTTKQVFEAIRQAKPPRLYVAADGARANKEGEAEKVQVVRDYIMQNIDWECDVKTLFRDQNLGCGLAPSSAITWFFGSEEQGIILEDDCLPSQSFFWYCEELLNKYSNDTRVWMVSGFNNFNVAENIKSDYFYTINGGIWGWASWRRAWLHYSFKVIDFDEFKNQHGFSPTLPRCNRSVIEKMIKNGLAINSAWDYQWWYVRIKNRGLSCVPKYNLIENLGFGTAEATHTHGDNPFIVNKHEISFPLKQPEFMVENVKYNKKLFSRKSLFIRLIGKIRRMLVK